MDLFGEMWKDRSQDRCHCGENLNQRQVFLKISKYRKPCLIEHRNNYSALQTTFGIGIEAIFSDIEIQ